ncbi:MAG: HAMP domain-containing histidine kinase [Chitinophagales bacterium]|nr:HAMP domain-containing histidine kinase [Chitinophagales bacterium]MDW8419055.1 HAMP domain-containing sensor histidine kinase [Chitinophagales bacterium]
MSLLKRILKADPLDIFHVVFAYIIIFAIWWAYLLYNKNEKVFHETVELQKIAYSATHPGDDFKQSKQYQAVYNKYLRQKLMIFLEGSVFIALVFVGLLRVRKVFKREMELAQQQKNFLLSITHELKSPISTIKLTLQSLGRRKLEEEQRIRMIDASMSDLERLHNLVDNILFAAKMEQGQHGFSREKIDMARIASEVCTRFANNKKSITIHTQIPSSLTANGDVLGFTSLVTNLVENAIKYSPESTTVTVALVKTESEVLLRVCDEGIGIPDNEKQKIFEKFYRVGNENTRTTKGTGLGLYIVKKYVEIFNGRIQVYDRNPRGVCFEITLPVE